jgi:hypothetical protein
MDKFKIMEYFIVYDFETMEEPLHDKNKDIFIAREDDNTSSSSLSEPSSNSSSFTQRIIKISHTILLSSAWAVKSKRGIKTAYLAILSGRTRLISNMLIN